MQLVNSMIGKKWHLVRNELVDFEKSLVDVQDCRKITDHFGRFNRIYLNLMKKN